MTTYYKPRKDVDCAGVLLPQKVVADDQGETWWAYQTQKGWIRNFGNPRPQLMSRNFVPVDTEEDCIAGY